MTRLTKLAECGQAPWLDFLRRTWIAKDLPKDVRDGVRGVTSNPSIFEKAIGESAEYDDDLRQRLAGAGRGEPVMRLFDALAIADIRAAADVLRGLYDQTGGADGFVSLEVSPYLANDTEATIAEARRLWKAVDRPNLMVKVPGTGAGVSAIRTLIGEGININVTLLFSVQAYEAVAEAYVTGLETLRANGGKPLSQVSSVASFFVSRIDSAVDKKLEAKGGEAAKLLSGKIAIANAKRAYQHFKKLSATPRWQALQKAGARPQRLLWASTGVKNPKYPDTLYVDTLIGRDTVNTMPPATLKAFSDHGNPEADSIEKDVEGAEKELAQLASLGISLDEVTKQLVDEGVRLFAEAFDQLLGALADKRRQMLDGDSDRQQLRLPAEMEKAINAVVDDWRAAGNVRRLWRGDASLWSGADEAKWLGWLCAVEDGRTHLAELQAFAKELRESKASDIVLLGMGGSSLGPEVIAKTLGTANGAPRFHMLDSTDPSQIRHLEQSIDLKNAWFIVASKSGSTLEPDIFKAYFFERLSKALGAAQAAAQRFVAITDPGSALEKSAKAEHLAHVFPGKPSIGGRYSVLSNFGLVPAAAIGVELPRFLERAQDMAVRCGEDVPPAQNPGVHLGIALGVLARDFRRDKVTVMAGPGLESVGAWLEQLIAESTGKNGRGLIPVDAEPAGSPAVYGEDRVFVHLVLREDAAGTPVVNALAKAGHPVVRIVLAQPYDLAGEFFRWEIATAVAGAVLRINPFDQPDVEASKIKTRALTDEVERKGHLPAEKPLAQDQDVAIFCAPKDAATFAGMTTLVQILRAHFGRTQAGDYIALLAYLERNEPHTKLLQDLRVQLRGKFHVATCLGFGPRFLHSTGQAYKGGPNSGVFLQLTSDDAEDVEVPGRRYSFNTVKNAQARGDLEVLFERNRRALRLHFKSADAGLATLQNALARALA